MLTSFLMQWRVQENSPKNAVEVRMIHLRCKLKWGGFDDRRLSEGMFVEDIRKVRELWSRKDDRSYLLISKYLQFQFVPSNVQGLDDIWDQNVEFDDIMGDTLWVVGLDFDTHILPTISAYSHFSLPLTNGPDPDGLIEWADTHDSLEFGCCWQMCEEALQPTYDIDKYPELGMIAYCEELAVSIQPQQHQTTDQSQCDSGA